MSTSPDLGIPFVATQQASPEITHNEALLMLQALLNGVIDIGDNAPPGSPTAGDAYIVGSSPTGAWSGKADKVALYTAGGWRFIPGVDSSGSDIPIGARHEGLSVYVRGGSDPARRLVWSGGSWDETGTSTPESFIEVQGGVGFQNGYANYGGSTATAAYYKDPFGVVHLKGSVTGPTGGYVIFTLPAGYRPAANSDRNFPLSGGTPGYVSVLANGDVTSGNGFVALDAVSFRAGA